MSPIIDNFKNRKIALITRPSYAKMFYLKPTHTDLKQQKSAEQKKNIQRMTWIVTLS